MFVHVHSRPYPYISTFFKCLNIKKRFIANFLKKPFFKLKFSKEILVKFSSLYFWRLSVVLSYFKEFKKLEPC